VAIVLALLMICTAAAFYRGLTSREYIVTSGKLHHAEAIRLVVLADLHSTIYGSHQKELIDRILGLAPDAIFLAGDIADDRNPFDGVALLLDGIAGSVPCYYVTGSHDVWSGKIKEIKHRLEDYGIDVLERETVTLTLKGQNLKISGIDDPSLAVTEKGSDESAAYRDALNAFQNIDRSQYNILLAHRPDFIHDYNTLGFDLVLCGHTHGGQLRIPLFLNGLFAPNQGYFPAYAGGLYDVDGTKLVVSRGLSYYPELPRIFNPPEVVVVELNRAN